MKIFRKGDFFCKINSNIVIILEKFQTFLANEIKNALEI